MAAALKTALALNTENPVAWKGICDSASAARFEWNTTAELYIEKLYTRS